MHDDIRRFALAAAQRERTMAEEPGTRPVQEKKSKRDLRRDLWDKTRRYIRRIPKIVLSNPERVALTLSEYRREAVFLGVNPDMLLKAAVFENTILA